jgi:hypothetical protein
MLRDASELTEHELREFLVQLSRARPGPIQYVRPAIPPPFGDEVKTPKYVWMAEDREQSPKLEIPANATPIQCRSPYNFPEVPVIQLPNFTFLFKKTQSE